PGLATLVLPAKGALEKSGTTINMAGDLLPVNAALQAPDGALSDLEMLYDLADALDVRVPAPDELERAVIAGAAAVADFSFGDPRFAMGHPELAEERTKPGARILDGGGTWQHDPSVAPLRTSEVPA
ncbi:MAG: hypothetical protein JO241_07165, partial [Candidatus Eremiobacteraeota bacterium]|nr:hypothetical protein [Candidatus Eremiobacteraeota bacterium]